MWVAQNLRGRDNTSFAIQQAFRLQGPLDTDALAAALTDLVARHEPLRTTFAVREGTLVQVVGTPFAVAVPVEPVPVGTSVDGARWVHDRADEIHRAGFDLRTGPLLRAELFAEAPERHTLVVTLHHIAADGWSMNLFYRDLAEFYAARVHGRSARLPELPTTYADWAQNCRRRLDADSEEALAYWRAQLRDIPAAVSLPTDRPPPPGPAPQGERVSADLDETVMAAVASLAKASRTSSFMVLLAAFATLAARWSGQDDQVLGTATANRSDPDTYDLVGCFVGVLPIRVRVRPERSFADVLQATRSALLEGQHHELPYELIVREFPRPATEPVFRIGISSFEGLGSDGLRLPGLDISALPAHVKDSPYDLSVSLAVADHRGRVDIAYPFALFDRSTIDTLLDAYVELLRAAVTEPGQTVGRLPLAGLRRATPDLPTPSVDAPDVNVSDVNVSDGDAPDGDGEPPAGPMEELIRTVWTSALQAHVTSRHDDFFLLGGSSLSAVQVSAELSDVLGFAVPLRTVYEYSDLSELAERLDELSARHVPAD
ncbi:hypothetical protein GCM10027290_31510 [Micromonospora sonneratiae]